MLIGPCLVAAPVVAAVAVLAIPLWPVSIVALGVAWLVAWPIEHTLLLLGVIERARASSALGHYFGFALRPWTIFDPPRRDS